MSRNNRILSVLMVACMLFCILGGFTTFASSPTTIDLATIAEVADEALNAFDLAISKGKQDINGIYYGVSYPATLTLNSYTMSSEEYIVMASSAICSISKSQVTAIPHKSITMDYEAVKNGAGNSLNMEQYVELAERVSKFATTTGKVPASFNRPTDGANIYEGRPGGYR